MLETIMLIGLGFVAATLIAFLLAPPFWRRAVRITTKRIQSKSPLTMAEIQAERDLMRAAFAQTTRKLEVTVEDLKRKTVDQTVDLARSTEKIGVLSTSSREALEKLKAREAEIVRLRERVDPVEEELSQHKTQMRQQAQELSTHAGEREALRVELRTTGMKLKEAEKFIERKERDIERLRKARAAGQGAGSRQRDKIEDERDALAEQLDKLSVRTEDMVAKLAALRAEGGKLKSAKVQLDGRGTIGREEAQAHRALIKAFNTERAALTAGLADIDAEARRLAARLGENDSSWQRDNANPYMDLHAIVEKLTATVSEAAGAVGAEFKSSEIETEAKLEMAEEQAPVRGNGSAAGGDADDAARKRSGRGASLAERIRALQQHVN